MFRVIIGVDHNSDIPWLVLVHINEKFPRSFYVLVRPTKHWWVLLVYVVIFFIFVFTGGELSTGDTSPIG